MQVNLGGIVHLSTVDWTGSAVTVVFLRGCPLHCPHCQNRDLQSGENLVNLAIVHGDIRIDSLQPLCVGRVPSAQITLDKAVRLVNAKPADAYSNNFVSGIVISGGEPLMQPEAVRSIARSARDAGLKVGLETCGYYPERMSKLLEEKLLDRIFLDIKAALKDPEYERATGRKNVACKVVESLRSCMRLGVPFEVRTTIFPEMPSSSEISEIAKMLSELKQAFPESRLEHWALQRGLAKNKEFEPVSDEILSSIARSIAGLVEVKLRDYTESKSSLDGKVVD
jgi:pyruvate formate lyase activating enzyme